jgi:catechol 2,3-dioxygenase-like lactoylglutathione lyase family enzyme
MSTRDEAWPDGEDTGHYGIAMVGGRAAAALGQAQPGMPTARATWHDLVTRDHTTVPGDHWRACFAVADADATVAAARAGGGQVQLEPWDTPYGRMAVLTDPQGAAFVVMGQVSRSGP